MEKSSNQLRIGLVGYGAIGRQVARRIAAGDLRNVALVGIVTRGGRHDEPGPAPYMTLEECAREADVLVEAASAEVVSKVLELAADQCRAVVVLSGCAFLCDPNLLGRAEEAGLRVLLPSAAVAGLDAALAAREESTSEICLTIRRPCRGIENARHIRESCIKLDELTKETLIFDGTPMQACAGFAGRTNITASVALAGIGYERTRVRIYADPHRSCHEHHLQISSAFGVVESRVEFAANHREDVDSIMTLSVLAAIREIDSLIRYST